MSRWLAVASLTLGLAVVAGPAGAEDVYNIDPIHSQPMYEIQHMKGISVQHGSFGKLTGKVTLDHAAKKGTIDVTIDTSTIRSHDARLDTILKGEDYFNVAKYPAMTFKSSDLKFDGDNVVGAEGELTMIGVTKPVTLKMTRFICGENPFNKKPVCGGEATATIKRSDWGMKTGIPVSSGDDVKLILPIEAYKE